MTVVESGFEFTFPLAFAVTCAKDGQRHRGDKEDGDEVEDAFPKFFCFTVEVSDLGVKDREERSANRKGDEETGEGTEQDLFASQHNNVVKDDEESESVRIFMKDKEERGRRIRTTLRNFLTMVRFFLSAASFSSSVSESSEAISSADLVCMTRFSSIPERIPMTSDASSASRAAMKKIAGAKTLLPVAGIFAI